LFHHRPSAGSGAFEYRQNHVSELVPVCAPLFSTHLSNSCSGAGCDRSTLSLCHCPVSGESGAAPTAPAKSPASPHVSRTASNIARDVRIAVLSLRRWPACGTGAVVALNVARAPNPALIPPDELRPQGDAKPMSASPAPAATAEGRPLLGTTAQQFALLEAAAGAEHHAFERGVRDDDGQPGLRAQQPIEPP
jgi:hypothetical protein